MFLAMPIVLFPAFATEVLKEPKLLGLLYSAEAIGAMVATLTSGWARRVHHHGRAVVLATITWGAVGRDRRAGAEHLVRDRLLRRRRRRGHDLRAVPRGDLEPDHPGRDARPAGRDRDAVATPSARSAASPRSGLVADLTSVRTAIVSGGVLCVAGVVATAVWLRDFWRYDARTDEHAVRERELRTAS